MDSLHGVLNAWNQRRKTKPASGKQAGKEPGLPWTSFREKDLPRELAAVTDSFHLGQSGAPFRSRMGFFIVRLSKLVPRQEFYFDDAVPRLKYVATRNNFLEKDSILEVLASSSPGIYGRNSTPWPWRILIRSRKWAKDTLPYRLVRNEILEKIPAPLPEQASGLATDESLDGVEGNLRRAIWVEPPAG